jgi:hypothetical protein
MLASQLNRFDRCPRDAEDDIDDMLLCDCGMDAYRIVAVRGHVHFQCIECGESLSRITAACRNPKSGRQNARNAHR